jgi:hypothetical protein
MLTPFVLKLCMPKLIDKEKKPWWQRGSRRPGSRHQVRAQPIGAALTFQGEIVERFTSIKEAATAKNLPMSRLYSHVGFDRPVGGYYWRKEIACNS